MGMRVSKKRNLASQISFLKPQDGSTEGLWAAWLRPTLWSKLDLPFPRSNTLPRNSLSSRNHHPGDPHVPAGPGPGHGHGRTCVPEAGCPAHACCSLIPALLPTRLTWAASGFALGSKIRSCLSWKSQEEKTAQLGQGGSLGAGRPASPNPRL